MRGTAGAVLRSAGAIGGRDNERAPIRVAPSCRCPVLRVFSGADGDIPREAIGRLGAVLVETGVANELVVDDGCLALVLQSLVR